jgi:hypothetical protein
VDDTEVTDYHSDAPSEVVVEAEERVAAGAEPYR